VTQRKTQQECNQLPEGYLRDILLENGGEFPEPSLGMIEYLRREEGHLALRKATEDNYPNVINAGQNAARNAGIPTPHIYVAITMGDEGANINPWGGHITVTEGIARMPQEQLEVVLLHEIGHGFQKQKENKMHRLGCAVGISHEIKKLGIGGGVLTSAIGVANGALMAKDGWTPQSNATAVNNTLPQSPVGETTTALTPLISQNSNMAPDMLLEQSGSVAVGEASFMVAMALFAAAAVGQICQVTSSAAYKSAQREAEFEADAFAAKAHNNIDDVVKALETLEQPEGKQSWLERMADTHPLPSERITHVKQVVEQLDKVGGGSKGR